MLLLFFVGSVFGVLLRCVARKAAPPVVEQLPAVSLHRLFTEAQVPVDTGLVSQEEVVTRTRLCVLPPSVPLLRARTRRTYIFFTYPLLSTLVITALGDWDRPAVAPSRTHSAMRAYARAQVSASETGSFVLKVCAAYIRLVQANVCATRARNCACHLLVRVNCRLLVLPLCHRSGGAALHPLPSI